MERDPEVVIFGVLGLVVVELLVFAAGSDSNGAQ